MSFSQISEQQLPLGFRLRDDATFESFFVAGNSQTLASFLQVLGGQGEDFLYIWGAEGSGRSHLLQAACHAAPENNKTAVYLPLEQLSTLSPDIFIGLEHTNLVCIDDIEKIAGDAIWEEQLFHLYNRIRASGNRLLVAANSPPAQLDIKLPDLKSRLSWGVVYQLHALDDEQKLAALQLRAQVRGLYLSHSVAKFLLRRCERNMAQLFATLEQLDQASLAKQRRLTIPFVKEILGV